MHMYTCIYMWMFLIALEMFSKCCILINSDDEAVGTLKQSELNLSTSTLRWTERNHMAN